MDLTLLPHDRLIALHPGACQGLGEGYGVLGRGPAGPEGQEDFPQLFDRDFFRKGKELTRDVFTG